MKNYTSSSSMLLLAHLMHIQLFVVRHTHTCIGWCLAVLAMPDWRWPHLSTSRRPQQSERGSLHRPGCNRLTLAPDFVRFALIVRLDRADAADLW